MTQEHNNHSPYYAPVLKMLVVMMLAILTLGIFSLRLSREHAAAKNEITEKITEQTRMITLLKNDLQKLEQVLGDHHASLNKEEIRINQIEQSLKDSTSSIENLEQQTKASTEEQLAWQKDYLTTLLKIEQKLDGAMTQQKELDTKIFLLKEELASKKIDGLKNDIRLITMTVEKILQTTSLEQKDPAPQDLHPYLFKEKE